MPRRALGIMAKVPLAGQVKTRLSPPLDAEQAELLYRAFLRDTILIGLAVPDCSVTLVHPPVADVSPLRELAPDGVALRQQAGAGLGDGMLGAFRDLWACGAQEVVLIGSDAPALPAAFVGEAFEALESGVDLVLGPSDDGGYYLIGLMADHPKLFEGITWSSDVVVRQTLERAAEAGLRVWQTPRAYDVDDAEGLARLVEDLGRDPRLHAPATRAALRTLTRLGARLPEPPIPWEVRASRRELTSPWRNLDVDRTRIHTGAEIDYTYFTTPDAVWVVPVTPEGEIVFVRQYRHPVRDWCLEVPAGSVIGKGLVQTARDELREEIGATAAELRFMGAFYSASAHLTLRGHVFLALDVALAEPELEETEMLVPVSIPAEIAFDMARRGEINEGESAMAVLFCERAIRAHLGA